MVAEINTNVAAHLALTTFTESFHEITDVTLVQSRVNSSQTDSGCVFL